ncbi:MAG: prepilin-type N-terminal cleavage/methylation domain-containing protein [Roseburia sp.]
MRNRLREKLRERKGFTLLEMIVVIAIIAVLGGLVTAGIMGYLRTAYTTRVNDTARTVFLAAQNYLTEQKQLGKLEEFNKQKDASGNPYAESLPEEKLKTILQENFEPTAEYAAFDAYYAHYTANYGTDHLAYIVLEDSSRGTADREKNPIYEIVQTYLNDTDILDHTFLMEYDTKTGVVRAVFYTEKADAFSYNSAYTDKDNVIKRDTDSLYEKYQGYYGVDITGLSRSDVGLLEPKNVYLYNGERLYLEWQEANYLSQEEKDSGSTRDVNDSFVSNPDLKDYLTYEVQVYRANGGEGGTAEELLCTISGITPTAAKGDTLAQADASVTDAGAVLAYDSYSNTYRLVLDDIDHSIFATYAVNGADAMVSVNEAVDAVKAGDYLYCVVRERLENHADYTGEACSIPSNVQSALYAGGAEKWSPIGADGADGPTAVLVGGNGHADDTAEDGTSEAKAYSIATARHLNNMRYGDGAACFVQTADIDWKVPEADRKTGTYVRTATVFEPLEFQTVSGGSILPGYEFTGMFRNGGSGSDAYVISNLKIEKKTEKNVGMFRQIGVAGTVDGIVLKSASVKAGYLAGVLAGCSSGTVKNVTLNGCTVEAAAYAGGITGYNYGTLTACTAKVDVKTTDGAGLSVEKVAAGENPGAGYYIGGAAGVNRGTMETVTVLAKNTANPISGSAYVGGMTGANWGEIKESGRETCSIRALAYAGGITGYNYESGSLSDCTAVASVEAFGDVHTVIMPDDATVAEQPGFGYYFGGIAGANRGTMTEVTSGKTDALQTVTGVAYVGGIAGSNGSAIAGEHVAASITNAYNCSRLASYRTAAGKILTVGDGLAVGASYGEFGGIAGYNSEDSRIEDCRSQVHIYVDKLPALAAGTPGYTDPAYISNIGGIAGHNFGEVLRCGYLRGSGAEDAVAPLIQECITAAKTGALPVYAGVNVGGIAGCNEPGAEVTACGVNGQAIAGYRNVGGIIGNNKGTVRAQESVLGRIAGTVRGASDTVDAGKVSGLVVASDYSAGGIIGNNAQKTLQSFTNGADVFAGSLAGGITGVNGVAGDYSFTTPVDDENYYNALLAPVFKENGIAVTPDSSMTISKCTNEGFVYAKERYAGGITGVNYGEILSSGSVVNLSVNTYLNGSVDDALATADCVGGIAGANFGNIVGDSTTHARLQAGVCGNDFVGGVIGLNTGTVKNIPTIYGDVWAKGIGVGGFIGLNTNGTVMGETGAIAKTDDMKVKGGYFVGGIMGMNATASNLDIYGLVTYSTTGAAVVSATAYAGGILGYNTVLTRENDISSLYRSEIEILIQNIYKAYEPYTGGTDPSNATIFRNCQNYAQVQADRYLGGIVGYNGEGSPLYIMDSINYGRIVVEHEERTAATDGKYYYFVGGITGRNSAAGIIHNCTNDGAVISPSTYLGGICEVNEGSIQFCYVGKNENYVKDGISGSNSVGGLVGLNNNRIVQCETSSFAKVTGGNNTGGIAGTNGENGIITGDSTKAEPIPGYLNADKLASAEYRDRSCVSSGSVTGGDNTGGIVGLNLGQVEQVFVSGAKITGKWYVGGFIGSNEGSIRSDIRNAGSTGGDIVIANLENRARSVTGENEVGGIVGRHNANLIVNCRNYGAVSIKEGKVGNAGGITGSVAKGIVIEDCFNYGTVTADTNGTIGANDSAHADIVRGMTKEERYGSHAGGITGVNWGTVQGCVNEKLDASYNGTVISEKSYAGGITGRNWGVLEDCVNIGSVEGARVKASTDTAIGGVVGVNTGIGTVKNCSSKANIAGTNQLTGEYTVGGLIGCDYGTLTNNAECRIVNIPIERNTGSAGSSVCRIGGIIGYAASDGTNPGERTYADYTYRGNINVTSGGTGAAAIGGIIGQLGTGMTLENCILDGSVTGYGNSSENNAGVGGIAGVSQGTIIVYKSGDYYAATTEDAYVEGNKNVGGLVGETRYGHCLKLKVGDEVAAPEELSVNQDADTSNDVFYTNIATVSGAARTGGCYGYLFEYRNHSKDHMENGTCVFNHYENRGNVKPSVLVAGDDLGGVIGSTWGTYVYYEFSQLYNYGTVGFDSWENADYAKKSTSYVAGIFGCIGGFQGVSLENIENYGQISAGQSYVAGIAGMIQIQVSDATKAENAGKAAIVKNVTNYGTIETKAKYVGGIIAGAYFLEMEDVENYGEIVGHGDNAMVYGGILGTTYPWEGRAPVVKLNNATNHAAITEKGYTNTRTDARIGGIVGNIGNVDGKSNSNGIVQVADCTNLANLMCESAGRTGGVIGYIQNGKSVLVTGCVNGAPESAQAVRASQDVGGIVGEIGTAAGITFRENVNYADVYGKYEAGGIIGKLSATGSETTWTLSDCENRGDIYPVLRGYIANHSISRIGGCVGYLYTKAQLSDFSNYGTIYLNGTAASNGNYTCKQSHTCPGGYVYEMNVVGGIAGYVLGREDNSTPNLYHCTNYGNILVSDGDNLDKTYTVGYVGGIAGQVSGKGALVSGCTNRAELSLADHEKGNTQYIGGIAGYVGSNAKLIYCDNRENVLSNGKKGKYVGGIAGCSEGFLYACETDYDAQEDRKLVTGYQYVGGIVGNAKGTTSKIAGYAAEDNSEELLVINRFDVSGTYQVGGIAGRSAASTMEDCLNAAGTTVTLRNAKGSTSRESCAGGIVGNATSADISTPSLLVNCYNFGKVRFEEEGSTRYLGGIIGYRNPFGNGTPAMIIKDCYYLDRDSGDDTYVDESQPDSKLSKAVLAVGNEPEGSYLVHKEDLMSGANELRSEAARYRWTPERYETLYRMLHDNVGKDDPVDTLHWDDMNQVIQDIIKPYNQYKLPVPDTTGVTNAKGNVVGEGYDYTLGVEKMAGFYEEVEWFLYVGDTLSAGVGSEVDYAVDEDGRKNYNSDYISSGTLKVTMDGQLDNIYIGGSKLKGHEGEVIKVALRAKGVTVETDSGDIVYSTDSDLEVVREFVVMPPLIAPEIEAVEQDGAVLTFRITNWNEYRKSAQDVYRTISAIADWDTVNQGIYKQLWNGVERFTVEDYYYRTEEAENSEAKETWTINRADVTEKTVDGTAYGYFTIDYAASDIFKAQKSILQWHEWQVKAVARDKEWGVERDTVEANEYYRYTTSEYEEQKRFRIEAEVPLNPPTGLTAEYVGGKTPLTEEDTPSYEVSFIPSTSPVEAVACYEITVTNPANNRTHTYSYLYTPEETEDEEQNPASEPVPSYTLTKQILLGDGDNELALDLSPGAAPTELIYTVRAIAAEDAVYFIDSEEKSTAIPVIRKGYPVDDITLEVKDPETCPNEWTYSWSDSHQENGDSYQVTFRAGTDVETVVTQDTFWTKDVSAYPAGTTLTITVMRFGKGERRVDENTPGTITRMDSDEVTYTMEKGEELPQVTDIKTVFDRIEGNDLVYKVTFTIPEGLTAENCAGFVLEEIVNNGEVLGTAETFAFDAAQPFEVHIPIDGNAGKIFYTRVTAKALLVVSSDSEAIGNYVTIPDNQLEPPTDITAIITVGETAYDLADPAADDAFLKAELADLPVALGWTLSGSTNNIKQQHLELSAATEEEGQTKVIWKKETGTPVTGISLDAEFEDGTTLTDYAGQTLTLRIYNESADVSLSLHSDVTEVTIKIPRLRLQAPEFAEDTAAKNVTVNKAVTDADGVVTLEEVAEDEKLPQEAFADLVYEVNWKLPSYEESGSGTEENDVLTETAHIAGTGIRLSVVLDEQEVDENGSPLVDEDGNPVWKEEAISDFGWQKYTEEQKVDGTPVAAVDGSILIPWGAEQNGVRLTGLSSEYAGRTIKVYVSQVSGKWDADGNLTEDAVWVNSFEAEASFVVPEAEETADQGTDGDTPDDNETGDGTSDGNETGDGTPDDNTTNAVYLDDFLPKEEDGEEFSGEAQDDTGAGDFAGEAQDDAGADATEMTE